MDRAKFFAALRAAGSKLSKEQVTGTEAILDALQRNRVTDIRHVSHSLAEVDHETGGGMQPVKETVYASSKDRNPSDATVIARLEKAWKAGKLGTVKTPYWRKGWFGRGHIQLTHEALYRKMGQRLGVDLVGNRDMALDMKISADAAVVGMKEGLFRTKKLADFNKAGGGYDHKGARGIVNGDVKKNGPEVAKLAAKYEAALRKAGFATEKAAQPDPAPPAPKPRPEPKPPATTAPGDVYASEAMVMLVQEKLYNLGYTEVGSRSEKTGKFDGAKGDMTNAAIMAFRQENGLPLSADIDAGLLLALDTAPKRKLNPGRVDATDQEVREKVPEARTSWLNKIIATVVGLPAGAIALVSGGLQYLGVAKETLAPVTDALGEVPSWVWFGAIGGVAVLLFLNARKGEANSIAAFKTGARR